MALATVPHLVSFPHTFYRFSDLGRCSAYTKACETAIAKSVPNQEQYPIGGQHSLPGHSQTDKSLFVLLVIGSIVTTEIRIDSK
jgi:hypothetical protein